jgi:hypothetical protein
MGIASGTVSFIEEFFSRLATSIEDGSDPTSVRAIAEEAREIYTELGRETAEHRVLEGFNLEISDLSENKHDHDPQLLSSLLSDVSDAQDDFAKQLEVLIAGVDGIGAHIFSIELFELIPQRTLGYHAVGSGTQPARSAFIRNDHDTDCSVKQGILNAIEAKNRSEDARGVGAEMDLAVVTRPREDEECCDELNESRKNAWADLYSDIVDAEQEARKEVMNEDDLTYGEVDASEDH